MEQIGISESNRRWEILGVAKKFIPYFSGHYMTSHLSENKDVWLEVEDCEERVQSNLRGYLRWEPLLPLPLT